MAPRRQAIVQQRYKEAFEAMGQIGFEKDVVKKTIKDILKVYGEAGWVFIEADGYEMLINTMLKEDQDQQDKLLLLHQENTDEDNTKSLQITEHCPSSGNAVLAKELNSGMGELIVTEGEGERHEEDVHPMMEHAGPPTSPQLNNPFRAEDANPSILQQSNNAFITGDVNPRMSQPQTDEAPRQTRPPCFGWISEEEDE